MQLAPTKINPFNLPSVALDKRSQLPNSTGIYFALRGDAVLYVGKTSDGFRDRWTGHEKLEALAIYQPGVRLAYLELPGFSDADLLAIEAAQIKRFCPRLNISGLPKMKNTHTRTRPSRRPARLRKPSNAPRPARLRAFGSAFEQLRYWLVSLMPAPLRWVFWDHSFNAKTVRFILQGMLIVEFFAASWAHPIRSALVMKSLELTQAIAFWITEL